MSPKYEIAILSPSTGKVLKVFLAAQLDELRYSIVLNGIGSLAMVFRGKEHVEEAYPLFNTDTLIEVYRDDQLQPSINLVKENTYLCRLRDRYIDDNGIDTFIVGGVDLTDFLARREINPADDSVQPNGGYATKEGPADTILREYIREQAGDLASTSRQTPGLTVPAVTGNGISSGKRERFRNLLTVCQEIAKQSAIDFYLRRVSGVSFQAIVGPRGTDKTYDVNRISGRFTVFDPKRGNLTSPRYTIDERKEKTYLYVMGSGEGANRFILEVPNPARIAASPFNRIEQAVDARNSRTGSAVDLLTEGREVLVTEGVQTNLEADVSSQLGGAKYREDWVLGDKVTIQWDSVRNDVRITELQITLTTEAGEDIKVKTERVF